MLLTQNHHPATEAGAIRVSESEFLRIAAQHGVDDRTARVIVAVIRMGDRRHVIGGVMYELVEGGAA